MNPNETLEELRGLLALHLEGKVHPDKYEYFADLVSELITNLDEWLSKGGFLPGDWIQGAHTHATTYGHIYAFLTASRVQYAGEGEDGYEQYTDGWVDPARSRFELVESRNYATPVAEWAEGDCPEYYDSPEEYAEDMVDLALGQLGSPPEANGDGTYYGTDEHMNPEDGSSWTYAVHFTRKFLHPSLGWTEESWEPKDHGHK